MAVLATNEIIIPDEDKMFLSDVFVKVMGILNVNGSNISNKSLTFFVKDNRVEYTKHLISNISVGIDKLNKLMTHVKSAEMMDLIIEHGATNLTGALQNAVNTDNLSLVKHCMKLGAGNLREFLIRSISETRCNVDVIDFAVVTKEISTNELIGASLVSKTLYTVAELVRRNRFSLNELKYMIAFYENDKPGDILLLKYLITLYIELKNKNSLLFNLPQPILENLSNRVCIEMKNSILFNLPQPVLENLANIV